MMNLRFAKDGTRLPRIDGFLLVSFFVYQCWYFARMGRPIVVIILDFSRGEDAIGAGTSTSRIRVFRNPTPVKCCKVENRAEMNRDKMKRHQSARLFLISFLLSAAFPLSA